ncbi:thioredoxin family protein [Paracoccaceae bacterium]|nr:thioredoxin family protein [Paracoccaceae bacterium]
MTDGLFKKYVLKAIISITFKEVFGLKKKPFFLLLIICFCGYINNIYAEVRGELLYFYADTCAYCKTWENEIANIYVKTEFEDEFKLSFINVFSNVELENYGISKTVKVTPTFIFVKDKMEVGRIEGYNGQELFWWQVDEIIKSNSQK